MIGTTTHLEVSTLGQFEIRRDHVPLSGGSWNRRKVNDLFKLLLSAEQHRLHREQIQEILWPSSTNEQAANSFGKTLYLLRRALEPDLVAGKGSSSTYLHLERDTLMLTPARVLIDADIFESSAKPLQAKMRSRSPKERTNEADLDLLNEFDHLLSLYKGDYLPEDVYEDWTLRRRDRLRRLYSWLLENAAELALANAQGQRACEYLQALLERNSADEQTHRQLMLVYARMGHRSDALNQYQLLRTALREELDAPPLPETTALFRSIQSGRIAVDLGEPQQVHKAPSKEERAWVTSNHNGKSQLESQPFPTQSTASNQDVAAPTVIQETVSSATQQPETTEDQAQINPERILKAELVGRVAEIQTMQRAYAQVRNGQRR